MRGKTNKTSQFSALMLHLGGGIALLTVLLMIQPSGGSMSSSTKSRTRALTSVGWRDGRLQFIRLSFAYTARQELSCWINASVLLMLVNNVSAACAPQSREWGWLCHQHVVCGPHWRYILPSVCRLIDLLLCLKQLVVFLLRAWLCL